MTTTEPTTTEPPTSSTPPPARVPAARPWLRTLLAGGAVVTAGLLVSRYGSGPVGDALGDALYAALVLLLVAFVVPRRALAVQAAVALAVCWAVEVAQATGGPESAVRAWPPLRYLLGTTFAWADLVWYAVGVLATWWLMLGTSRGRVGATGAATTSA
ncbi:DUF2809 domain-containing protein [Cellulomonas triticagri]|uniref:DUF2809 domain-containing protein n=1 Tax=Cellulomonas triticagri TaxID=2483352 RepID=UPI0018F700A1|nr:DUF2809 domain-containing protein [Cellulomonas triticagri]